MCEACPLVTKALHLFFPPKKCHLSSFLFPIFLKQAKAFDRWALKLFRPHELHQQTCSAPHTYPREHTTDKHSRRHAALTVLEMEISAKGAACSTFTQSHDLRTNSSKKPRAAALRFIPFVTSTNFTESCEKSGWWRQGHSTSKRDATPLSGAQCQASGGRPPSLGATCQ